MSQVTKGESLKGRHLNIILKARNIIIIIISISRRLYERITLGTTDEATEMRLLASDTTNLQKDGQDDNQNQLAWAENDPKWQQGCLYSRRRGWSKQRKGSRGISNILSSLESILLLLGGSRLLMRPLGLGHQLCSAPSHRFLTNSSHDWKEMGKRNRNVHVCENVCDSWRKD